MVAGHDAVGEAGGVGGFFFLGCGGFEGGVGVLEGDLGGEAKGYEEESENAERHGPSDRESHTETQRHRGGYGERVGKARKCLSCGVEWALSFLDERGSFGGGK